MPLWLWQGPDHCHIDFYNWLARCINNKDTFLSKYLALACACRTLAVPAVTRFRCSNCCWLGWLWRGYIRDKLAGQNAGCFALQVGNPIISLKIRAQSEFGTTSRPHHKGAAIGSQTGNRRLPIRRRSPLICDIVYLHHTYIIWYRISYMCLSTGRWF